jgi:HAD superfamily hydrolase (TIGR01509 family)
MKIPDSITALIFDCDGTLVDTMPAHYVAWCEALKPYGIAFPEHRFYALAGVPTAKIVEILAGEQGVKCDPLAVAEEKDQRYLEVEIECPPIEKVVAIARGQQGRRRMAVASGNRSDIVRASLRGADIEELFEVVVGADHVVRGKPAPDLFLHAASLLATPPEQCMVFEDGDLGLQAGRAAGMMVVDVRPWLSR